MTDKRTLVNSVQLVGGARYDVRYDDHVDVEEFTASEDRWVEFRDSDEVLVRIRVDSVTAIELRS